MKKVFLYPKNDKNIGSPNPYMSNFYKSLSKIHEIVNYKVPNRGVYNLIYFFWKTDFFIFNWIEYLPEKKWGKTQTIIFLTFLKMAKLFNKKIIWILHNKKSHHKKENKMTGFIFKNMMRYSSTIITHSNTGFDFVKTYYPKYQHKVKVLIHPIEEMFSLDVKEKKIYDFIIWGTIFPYKGIDRFLKFINTHPEGENLSVLILGKCHDFNYKKKLEQLLTKNITYYDEMYSLEEIAKFSNKSKYTLFTYNSDSVISSGSLIDAIRMGSNIIGPNHGAFKDLNHLSFLETYDEFEEVIEIYKNFHLNSEKACQERQDFYKDNNWNVFIQQLDSIIK